MSIVNCLSLREVTVFTKIGKEREYFANGVSQNGHLNRPLQGHYTLLYRTDKKI